MLNNSRICLLAFTTSSLHPRVRAETCNVTTAPNPELSIIGTSFKSKTIRPFFPQASSISIFSSGTFSVVNLPKHSTTQPSSTSRRFTRNPRAELAPSITPIATLRPHANPHPSCPLCTSFPPLCLAPPASLVCRGGACPALLGRLHICRGTINRALLGFLPSS